MRSQIKKRKIKKSVTTNKLNNCLKRRNRIDKGFKKKRKFRNPGIRMLLIHLKKDFAHGLPQTILCNITQNH